MIYLVTCFAAQFLQIKVHNHASLLISRREEINQSMIDSFAVKVCKFYHERDAFYGAENVER